MSVKITGIEDVNRILGDLAPKEARNILRAVVYDIAKTAADTAKDNTPEQTGELKASIKARRDRGDRTKIEASVRVTNNRRNFIWKFLEFGTGPDRVEHAMFGKALESMRPKMGRIYVEAFAAKLIARLKRARKKQGL